MPQAAYHNHHFEFAPVDGKIGVRIRARTGVRRKVLGRRHHAGGEHPVGKSAREIRDDLGIAVKGAVTDDIGQPEIEIHDGGKAHVDADGEELGRQEPAAFHRGAARGPRIRVMQVPERAHGRDGQERLAKSLHAPALVIDRYEQRRRPERMDLGNEPLELGDVGEIPGEQNHSAYRPRREPVALLVGERSAPDADHERTQRHDG